MIPENNVEEAGWGDRRSVYGGCVDIVAAAPSAAFFWRCTAKIPSKLDLRYFLK